MSKQIRDGDCVRLPDGRPARVRQRVRNGFKVRVRRKTSDTHQFLLLKEQDIELISCPKGWMSPEGYRRYLRTTLAKMRIRQKASRAVT